MTVSAGMDVSVEVRLLTGVAPGIAGDTDMGPARLAARAQETEA